MIVWTHAGLGVLYACVLYFCICTCSAQLIMFDMERHSRNSLIIIIIIIVIIIIIIIIIIVIIVVVVVVAVVVHEVRCVRPTHSPSVRLVWQMLLGWTLCSKF